MVSKRTQRTVGTIVGIVGVAISVIVWPALFLIGPERLPINDVQWALIMTVGLMMIVLGFGLRADVGMKIKREKVADFVTPILQSKGKVSLHEIATQLKMSPVEVTFHVQKMIEEGYFEGTRLDGAWLVREFIPCPYCGSQVRLTERKCPNCGAAVKSQQL